MVEFESSLLSITEVGDNVSAGVFVAFMFVTFVSMTVFVGDNVGAVEGTIVDGLGFWLTVPMDMDMEDSSKSLPKSTS